MLKIGAFNMNPMIHKLIYSSQSKVLSRPSPDHQIFKNFIRQKWDSHKEKRKYLLYNAIL